MKTHILRALSERSFFNLWMGEVFTQISINILNFFLILLVYQQTQSNTAVSAVILTFTIPAILFGSIAGAYVDHWNKKKVLLITNASRAFLLLVLAINADNIALIYIISLLIGIITQFFIPAETPMIPIIVKRENLLSANALFGMGISGSIVVAYVLSGPLMKYLGEIETLIFLAIMLLIGACFIWFIRLPSKIEAAEERASKQKINILHDIKYAFSFLSKQKEISQALFFLALTQVLTLVIATVAPGYANSILHVPIQDFSLYFAAPAALGMIVGAIILVNFFHNYSKEKIITFGIFLSGIAMMFLPYGSKVVSRGFVQTINVHLAPFFTIDILFFMIFLVFLIGIANALVFVPANTIVQENTTDELRGKIYGFLNTIVGVFSLLPILIVGGLSDLIGVGSVILGIGLSLFILGISRLFSR